LKKEADGKGKSTQTNVEFIYSLPSVHQRPVNVIRFSPNGQYLASGGDDGAVVLWVQKYREMDFGSSEKKLAWTCNRIFRGHSGDVYELAWSADSKYVISCSLDSSAVLFNVEKGKMVQRLEGHKKTVQGCTIDPFMKYIVTVSPDRTARVYKTTKGKAQLQFYLHHILKYRSYHKKEDDLIMSDIKQNDDEDSLSSLAYEHKQAHIMFAGESECPAFQRRISWSPEGSFLLLTGCIFKSAPGVKPIFTVYGFGRKNLSQPAFHLPGFEKCPLVARFCPYLFVKSPSPSQELIDLPYTMIFAIASMDIVAIYSTQSIYPLAVVRNIHYHSITDLAFSGDKYLLISSSDGYCSIVRFDEGVFGKKVKVEDMPLHIQPFFKDYDKIDVNDITQFTKGAPTPVTSIFSLKGLVVATFKSGKNKEFQLVQQTERGEPLPKAPPNQKRVRRIVPTLITPEPMDSDEVKS